MSENWYPQIDYDQCVECGACIKMCKMGAYDKDQKPKPVVVRPELCVETCHGCGNDCPVGAITYFGDNTGWVPPNLKK
jgi:NAD-dependent dihydropyrimidine dehydrogenase PreA subunit